jgi:hypothetical protein
MAPELRRGRTVEEVALALQMLAFYSGNVSRAARTLTEAGHPISARTLARWRDSNHELYWKIVREIEDNAAESTIVKALLICEERLGVLERGFDAMRGSTNG